MSYIGNEPIVSATRTVTEVTATAGQTVFTANGGYTVGFLDVFINGSKLTSADFTATDGSTVTLTEAAQVNDIVRLEALGTFLASSALSNVNPSYTGTLTGGTGVVNIGSGQLYKDASGNVGIGTASPQNQLHINGTTTGYARFQSSNRTFTIGSLASAYGFVINDVDAGQQVMQIDAGGLFKFNSGYGSVATAYGCRAWGSIRIAPSIVASGNVSSVIDSGGGTNTQYLGVNLSTAMPDSNYSVVTGHGGHQRNYNNYEAIGDSDGWASKKSSSYFEIDIQGLGGLSNDTNFYFAIFR